MRLSTLLPVPSPTEQVRPRQKESRISVEPDQLDIIDYITANDPSLATPLTEQQRSDLYAELASGAESGWDYTGEFMLDESGSEAADMYEKEVTSDRESGSDGSILGLVGEADLGYHEGEYGGLKDYGSGLEDVGMDF